MVFRPMFWQKLRGKFIVLDGPDGCGKTTQIRLLSDFIESHAVACVVVRDPGGTGIGEQIRNILLDQGNGEMSVRCETLLYMASRAQLYAECIAPALQEQKCVLCDRWVSSTYSYQAVAGEIGAELVLRVAQDALERTWPDLTVIIDLPSEMGLTRLGDIHDRMEAKPVSFHRRVRQAFLDLARSRADFKVIDGSGSIEQVHQRLREVMVDYVNA